LRSCRFGGNRFKQHARKRGRKMREEKIEGTERKWRLGNEKLK
jgi:hypothetical protein